MYYTLDENGIPVPIDAMTAELLLAPGSNRWQLIDNVDGASVSTVFLPIMHFGDTFFETMIFDHPDGEEHQMRYKTQKEAIRGHNWTVAHLKLKQQQRERAEQERTSHLAVGTRKRKIRISKS